MVPFYAARIEDLGLNDFVVVECRACNNVGLLSAVFLLKLGFPPYQAIKDLHRHARCRGCGVRAKADISIRWGKDAA
jgi:hypothetical protein